MLLFVGLVTIMTGCYPGGPEYLDEVDLVFTAYDKEYNFSGKKNYAMPDKIVKITGELVSGSLPTFINATYANPILNRIKDNMARKGYTLVSDTTLADLILFPAAVEVTTTSVNYYDYWGYYGWYYPYYGWYYPYPVVTSYSTGTLFMNILDKSGDLTANDKTRVVWTGWINGLLEGSSSSFTPRINKTIDQAFTQSPQLKP